MRLPSTDDWSSELIELFVLEVEHVTASYVGWLNDPRINRYLESRFAQHTVESTQMFVDSCARSEQQLFLGIRYRPFERHVGNVKLDLNRNHGLAEVGILVGEADIHGKGVASSAIDMVANIARRQLGLRKLAAGCYVSNTASERAFLKAGFVVEGRRLEHFLLDGRPEALTLMGRIL